MKKIVYSAMAALFIIAGAASSAHAIPNYLANFESTYPAAAGTVIDTCTLCHENLSTYARNPFGLAFASNGHSFSAIEGLDSDGDGFTNLEEITALTFPGDPASTPAPAPVNQPPIANAGPDQTVVEGDTVTLDGSNSSDPDDGIASYAWKQTTGPAVTLSDAAAVNPTFTAPQVGMGGGSLTFQLTVTDNGGLTATDTVIVNITPATPVDQPPVANAGPDQVVDSGATVYLSGANSTDLDDGIASYLWKQTAGPAVTLSNPTDVSPSFIAPDGGTSGTSLTFELTVTDFAGLQSTDTCIINVNPSGLVQNLPPVADAGPDQTAVSGQSVTLDGSNSSDPDGGIASYLWTQTAGPSVTLSSTTVAQPSFTVPAVSNSVSLTFKLTVTDAGGLMSSDSCTVQVSAGTSRSGDDEEEDGGYRHYRRDDSRRQYYSRGYRD